MERRGASAALNGEIFTLLWVAISFLSSGEVTSSWDPPPLPVLSGVSAETTSSPALPPCGVELEHDARGGKRESRGDSLTPGPDGVISVEKELHSCDEAP